MNIVKNNASEFLSTLTKSEFKMIKKTLLQAGLKKHAAAFVDACSRIKIGYFYPTQCVIHANALAKLICISPDIEREIVLEFRMLVLESHALSTTETRAW